MCILQRREPSESPTDRPAASCWMRVLWPRAPGSHHADLLAAEHSRPRQQPSDRLRLLPRTAAQLSCARSWARNHHVPVPRPAALHHRRRTRCRTASPLCPRNQAPLGLRAYAYHSRGSSCDNGFAGHTTHGVISMRFLTLLLAATFLVGLCGCCSDQPTATFGLPTFSIGSNSTQQQRSYPVPMVPDLTGLRALSTPCP